MKYIKIMSMIAFIGIYMAGCSQGHRKRNYIFYTRENKDTKEDAPVEKQEQEKNEESQAIQTNEQVEHKQEEVSSDEKKEETTPVPAEQPVQNNEQKVESNEKQGKFLVVIDPGHQQKRI